MNIFEKNDLRVFLLIMFALLIFGYLFKYYVTDGILQELHQLKKVVKNKCTTVSPPTTDELKIDLPDISGQPVSDVDSFIDPAKID